LGRKRIHQDANARWRAHYRKKKKEAQPYYAKRAEMRQMLEAKAALEVKEAQGVYDVVVIDPPWPVSFQGREAYPEQVALPYATMTVDAIRALRLPLAESAHVWLWTTQRFLPEAFTCLAAWGLAYSGCFVWAKAGGMQPLGLFQMNCEFALYARKGPALFVETKDFKTCFPAPRGAHSAKPDFFYAMVRRVTAGRRLDMFNRRPIDGFDGWGNEAPTAGGALVTPTASNGT
jgi:N6-adenosine-specific RNA methylase IME4